MSAATRADALAGRLGEEIACGRLPPGMRLDEAALSRRFSVSRTPVREALRQLETLGLVARRPYCGAVVASPSPETVLELLTAMEELEGACARQAALRMRPAERRRLRAAHDAMAALVRDGDPTAYAEANVAFHEALYAGAHNATLRQLAAQLRRRVAPLRQAQFNLQGRLALSHAEHEAIVVAVERADADEAASCMRRHMHIVGDAIEDATARLRDGGGEA